MQQKLNYDQILDILKKYTTIESFCEDNYFLQPPDDFKFSNEVQIKIDANKKAISEWEKNGKGYNGIYYKNLCDAQEPVDLMRKEFSDFLGLGNCPIVDHYGGNDLGSDYYSVRHFVDHDVYIKVSGWYQSYSGVEFASWDNACKEVRSNEKTITVYE